MCRERNEEAAVAMVRNPWSIGDLVSASRVTSKLPEVVSNCAAPARISAVEFACGRIASETVPYPPN
jgi:hypothetical protein